ncbi:MAG: sigma-54 dependent transcriptional regulator [Myxococcota bacterium]|nr:sigma-54 dependent transcriptional regulator [Myxococcota bacterium]
MSRVLVVDDAEYIRLVLRTVLARHGYDVDEASSGEQALDRVADAPPDFVLADVRMPGMSGIDLVRALRERGCGATVIVMSAFGSVELAIEAMKAGAYDYVSKPFKQDEVLLALRKAEEREQLRRENRALRAQLDAATRLDAMVGRSEPMQRLFRTIERVAAHRTTVLVTGESGTGKELVARALHRLSPRAARPFVAVNCGAIPPALLESELFGHRRGAFTDATADKRGLFEEAHGGTLFLDEIGELPLSLQVKLLRVLQEGSVRRLGETRDVTVDVRVVAATVRDLQEEVRAGRFREDLYYRLNVVSLRVPPLRERREDIPLLVEHFLDSLAQRLHLARKTISQAALARLVAHDWPGNVRELGNVMERAVVLAEGDVIDVADLSEPLQPGRDRPIPAFLDDEISIKKAVRRLEAELIRRALERTGGNRTRAARLLEISHRALLYKIKDYGIG